MQYNTGRTFWIRAIPRVLVNAMVASQLYLVIVVATRPYIIYIGNNNNNIIIYILLLSGVPPESREGV